MIRKILTEEEKQRRERRRNIIISIVLGLIMLLSTAGYAFFSFEKEDNTSKNKININGIDFIMTERGTWGFSYGGNNYETLFNPNDTLNISVKLNKDISVFYNKPLYFGINSKEDISTNGRFEIEKNLFNIFEKSQLSCLSQDCSIKENYPVKNCSNNNVIIFKRIDGNISRVYEKDSCINIEFALGDEEKSADAFLFGVIGIKNSGEDLIF